MRISGRHTRSLSSSRARPWVVTAVGVWMTLLASSGVFSDAVEVEWKTVSGCNAGSSCMGSFSFVKSDDILLPRLATIEVLDNTSKVLDIAKYNSDSMSWLWYVSSLLPTGQYQFRYNNSKGGFTLTSGAFSVVGKFGLCSPENYTPRTMDNPDAIRLTSPLATTLADPGEKVSLYLEWVDANHDFGKDVLSLSIDMIKAKSRKSLGDVVKSFDVDPKSSVQSFLVAKNTTAGSYILRLKYVLSDDPKTTMTSFSEVFSVGQKASCDKDPADGGGSGPSNPGTQNGGSDTGSGTTGGNKDSPFGSGSALSSSSGLSTGIYVAIIVGSIMSFVLFVAAIVFLRRRWANPPVLVVRHERELPKDEEQGNMGGDTPFMPMSSTANAAPPPPSYHSNVSTTSSAAPPVGGFAAANNVVSASARPAGRVPPVAAPDAYRRLEDSGSATVSLCTACGRVGEEGMQFCGLCGAKLMRVVVTADTHIADAVAIADPAAAAASLPPSSRNSSATVSSSSSSVVSSANRAQRATAGLDTAQARKQAILMEHVGGEDSPSSRNSLSPASSSVHEVGL